MSLLTIIIVIILLLCTSSIVAGGSITIWTHCIATAWELPSDSHIYHFTHNRHYVAYMNTINWHILSALVTRVVISRL